MFKLLFTQYSTPGCRKQNCNSNEKHLLKIWKTKQNISRRAKRLSSSPNFSFWRFSHRALSVLTSDVQPTSPIFELSRDHRYGSLAKRRTRQWRFARPSRERLQVARPSESGWDLLGDDDLGPRQLHHHCEADGQERSHERVVYWWWKSLPESSN